MIVTRHLGMFFLAIWLLCTGISQLATIKIPHFSTIMALLAILAGIFIAIGR
jgi:hypothetical protein